MIPPNRPAYRWAVPGAVAAALVLAGTGAVSAASRPDHESTAAGVRLVAAVRTADVSGLSGTVAVSASLGLPPIPGVPARSRPQSVRVWLAGPDRARAELGTGDRRLDLYRDHDRAWLWDAATRTATRVTPSAAAPAGVPDPVTTARTLLDGVARASTVTTDRGSTVAGRAATTLVVRPTDRHSLVGSVRVAVDDVTRLPLAVEVVARGSDRAAVKVAFTRIRFAAPAPGAVRFTPPAGAHVRTASVEALPVPRLVGHGWSTVLAGRAPAGSSLAGLIRFLPRVHGDWGTGRLLESSLVTALITDDGRVFAGAVHPSVLYAAARR